jgi:hypothetical protein
MGLWSAEALAFGSYHNPWLPAAVGCSSGQKQAARGGTSNVTALLRVSGAQNFSPNSNTLGCWDLQPLTVARVTALRCLSPWPLMHGSSLTFPVTRAISLLWLFRAFFLQLCSLSSLVFFPSAPCFSPGCSLEFFSCLLSLLQLSLLLPLSSNCVTNSNCFTNDEDQK